MKKDPCPKRALVALDTDEGAVIEAVRFAAHAGADLTGLFVLDATWNDYTGHDWLSGSNSRADFLDWVKGKELEQAKAAVEQFERAAADIPHRVLTRAGRVVDELLRELDEQEQQGQGYDLLILPRPFRRGLECMRDPEREILKKVSCSIYFVANGADQDKG